MSVFKILKDQLHIAFHNYNSFLNLKDIIVVMIQECIKKFVNPVDGKGVSFSHLWASEQSQLRFLVTRHYILLLNITVYVQ